MLLNEKYACSMRNELETELALLESFLSNYGLNKSLAGDIMRKAQFESIETGRSMIDILDDYCARLRMGFAIVKPVGGD